MLSWLKSFLHRAIKLFNKFLLTHQKQQVFDIATLTNESAQINSLLDQIQESGGSNLSQSKENVEIVANKYIFKLYDIFGSICYEGDNYDEVVYKANLLPYTAFIRAFDENGKFVAVVWAAPGTGMIVTDINILIPN